MDRRGQTCESGTARAISRRSAGRARGVALLVLLPSLGLIGMGMALTPDSRGYGTHEQLGSAPCGFLLVTGYPCPTCGMTTAFCHAVRGQWLQAIRAQPAGFAFALAVMAVATVAIFTLFSGRWPRRVVFWLSSPWLFIVLLAVLLAGWASKLAVGLLDGSIPAP